MTEIRTVTTLLAKRDEIERSIANYEARLEQALDIEPHNRRALAEQAVLYEVTGMPQRAYVLYERILEREPAQATIAQKLDTAEKPDMPESAIASGCIDFILSPEDISREIVRIAHGARLRR